MSLSTRMARIPARLLLGLIGFYRLFFSAWLGNTCRFEPSCSRYAAQAIQAHGAAHGSYLSLRRIARCNPLCAGGHDPVPPSKAGEQPHLFTRLNNRADS